MRITRLVTKHCEPKFWKGLHDGNVRIGSLSGYRKSESASGLLDDKQEGQSQSIVNQELTNKSFSIGGVVFENITTVDTIEHVVEVQQDIDANVFCTSEGPYDYRRHLNIIEGNEKYPSNPDCTAFVEYNVERLNYAMLYLGRMVYGPHSQMISRLVEYTGRQSVILPDDMENGFEPPLLDERARNAIFLKPPRFNIEEEYRFAINVHKRERNALFTADSLRNVRRNFAKAIHNQGALLSKE